MFQTKKAIFESAWVIWFAVCIAAAISWVVNVVKTFQVGPLAEWSGFEVARVIGIFFPPLGAVMGFL
ncbi:hypothetical protein [Bordetella trematum]|uniref:hypothetical protein n=1 Tax=Bordetella trematum TaxID=123899 RepID=UPI003989D637